MHQKQESICQMVATSGLLTLGSHHRPCVPLHLRAAECRHVEETPKIVETTNRAGPTCLAHLQETVRGRVRRDRKTVFTIGK